MVKFAGLFEDCLENKGVENYVLGIEAYTEMV